MNGIVGETLKCNAHHPECRSIDMESLYDEDFEYRNPKDVLDLGLVPELNAALLDSNEYYSNPVFNPSELAKEFLAPMHSGVSANKSAPVTANNTKNVTSADDWKNLDELVKNATIVEIAVPDSNLIQKIEAAVREKQTMN